MRINEILSEHVTAKDLHRIERHVNDLWDDDNVEINLHQRSRNHPEGHSHFLQQANNSRNHPEITPDEIEQVFVDAHDHPLTRDYVSRMNSGSETVLSDPSTKINIPVMAQSPHKNYHDPEGKDTEIVPKTIMRKRNFLTHNTSPKVAIAKIKPSDSGEPPKLNQDERMKLFRAQQAANRAKQQNSWKK